MRREENLWREYPAGGGDHGAGPLRRLQGYQVGTYYLGSVADPHYLAL